MSNAQVGVWQVIFPIRTFLKIPDHFHGLLYPDNTNSHQDQLEERLSFRVISYWVNLQIPVSDLALSCLTLVKKKSACKEPRHSTGRVVGTGHL